MDCAPGKYIADVVWRSSTGLYVAASRGVTAPAIPRRLTNSADMSAPPALRTRVIFALVIGLITACYAFVTHRSTIGIDRAPDSLVFWRGARIVLAGGDPYRAADWQTMPVGEGDVAAWTDTIEPLYYPLPALLIWIPFSLGSFVAGSAAFCGIGAALFAFAVSRQGLHRIWLCGGVPVITAVHFGQWATWLTAAAMLPWLAFVLPAKPNIGLAVGLSRPTRAMVAGAIAIVVLSIVVLPRWPLEWFRIITGAFRNTVPHPAPILTFGGLGVVLLAALLRWRRAEARLLVLMACVPQLPFWADQLPLAMVAETRREVIWSLMAGHLCFIGWYLFAPKVVMYVPVMQPYALIGTYAPALVMILRRPNAGPAPVWSAELVNRLPRWLRGTDAVAAPAART